MATPKKWKLKKITPRALRVYKQFGFLSAGDKSKVEAAQLMFEIYTDTDKLKDLLAVTFNEKLTGIDDIDLSLVSQGVRDFLAQLSPRSIK